MDKPNVPSNDLWFDRVVLPEVLPILDAIAEKWNQKARDFVAARATLANPDATAEQKEVARKFVAECQGKGED